MRFVSFRFSLLRGLPLLAFALMLALLLILLFRFQRKPLILESSHLVASAGDRIELNGRYFGRNIEGAQLIFGGQVLPSSGIIEWSDRKIVLRISRLNGSVLVKVKTHAGLSNGIILADARRFPRVEHGPWFAGAPFLESIEPPSGGPGTLVVLKGAGFGERQAGGRIFVNHADSEQLVNQLEPNLELYQECLDIDLWTDTEIHFWIPPGASTGYVYVQKGLQLSNPLFFEIVDSPGYYSLGTPTLWSLRQDVIINRVGAFPGNSLYIRVPVPVPGSGQDSARVKEDASDYRHLRREGLLDIYRIDELESGEEYSITRQIMVQSAAMSTQINPENLRPYNPYNPELATALVPDEWIRPDLVGPTAAKIASSRLNDWQKSRAVYDYVIDTLGWLPTAEERSVPEYLSNPLAGSEGYSFLFCSLARALDIPARPVGGIVIDTEGKSRLWWWAEFWIEGLGWVPVDPAMADLGDDAFLPEVDSNPRAFYFGGLEGRHLAFSRGIEQSRILQPNTVRKIPDEHYTLQGIWEEVSGNLVSYNSSWTLPELTASR